jgi:YHS domain-containing protein
MFKKPSLLAIAALGIVLAGGLSFNAVGALSGTQKPSAAAVDGYDLVSFFKGDGAADLGNARFVVMHEGKSYRFMSQSNADAFKANPTAYLPQYGGHCAWAAAQGYVAPGYPQFGTVVKGKLYFNYNAKVQADWSKDVVGFIAKADSNLPKLVEG